jgi:hypothetical protein
MSATSTAPDQSTRRSTRVRLEINVLLTALNSAAQEHCQTVVVNPQGCGLRTGTPLQPGSPVCISELPGGHSVTGSVANCVPVGTDGAFWLVGVAFDEPADVWGIPTPPADWAPHSEKAANLSAKKTWQYSEYTGQGKPVWKK